MHTPSFIIRGDSSGFNPPHALTLALRATRFARVEPVWPYWRERSFKRCFPFLCRRVFATSAIHSTGRRCGVETWRDFLLFKRIVKNRAASAPENGATI
jgi:hypothetical protein